MNGFELDSERGKREWEAQERALGDERAALKNAGGRGRDGSGLEAAVAEYRLIARVLRNPPLAPLPSDFAARTAARVRAARAANEGVEIWLERGLLALLLLGGAAALFVYSGDWLRELSFEVPEGAVAGIRSVASWSIAVAACVGISSAFSLARRP